MTAKPTDEGDVEHRDKVAGLAGSRPGMYPSGYLEQLRAGWPSEPTLSPGEEE